MKNYLKEVMLLYQLQLSLAANNILPISSNQIEFSLQFLSGKKNKM